MASNSVLNFCKTEACAVLLAFAAVLSPSPARAHSDELRFELGLQFARNSVNEFDSTDSGLGGRVTFNVTRGIGLEAELNFYPGDLTEVRPFSGGRAEGLFGVKVGATRGRLSLFGKARPGFLRFGEAREPLACILIFPPPLDCALAAGHTAFALDLGGGAQLRTSERTFVRFDVGDNLVRYDVGPVLRPEEGVVEGAFWTNNFRFTIGGGLRF